MQKLKHPCFAAVPSGEYARIHLPVAPKCNIQCNYCDRRYDCANESRPGVSSKVLSSEVAVQAVREAKQRIPQLTVAGIAGPGEPLYNEETFFTFEKVKREFPDLILCVSTNGALLEEKLAQILDLKIETLTVTLNSLDRQCSAQIYRHTGDFSIEEFMECQQSGIQKAAEAGLKIKINTVLIPGVNENEVMKIAEFGKKAGAIRMNLMPLIPAGAFRDLKKPEKEMTAAYRHQAEEFLPQMYHCRQCRADACGFLI